MRLLPSVVLASLLVLPAAARAETTGVLMISTPGDYIGQGTTRQFLPASSSISVSGSPAFVRVSVSNDEDDFDLEFVPPSTSTLKLGAYPDALRYPFQSPVGPGMSITGDGRGCNQLKGWFRVREFRMTTSGILTKLAIDFLQRCEISGAPLYGAIRYNSSLALAVPKVAAVAGSDFEIYSGGEAVLDGTQSFARKKPPLLYHWTQISGPSVVLDNPSSVSPAFTAPDVPATGAVARFRLDVANQAGVLKSDTVKVRIRSATAPRTSLVFYGDAGDYISLGRVWSYNPLNSIFSFSRNFDEGVSLFVDGATWWHLDFAMPGGMEFQPGTYTNAQRFPFQAANRPGLSLSGDGRGCNTLKGSFTVYEAEFDEEGQPERLNIVFEQHCEGGATAAYGELLLNSVPHDALASSLEDVR